MDKQLKMKELRVYAEEIRVKTLEVFAHLGFGHVGGAMSVVETVAVLYGSMMKYDPKNPSWPDRDKLIMSKGHAGPTLYATLAMKGFFPESMLLELNQGGGRLPSHCDRNKTPGIDMTTGSLGQGISAAIGIALGDKMDGRSCTTYAILGDGELDEGQNWEGFMFANHYKLDNLVVFIDANGQQLDGYTKDIMDTASIAEKLRAFGWFTQDIDGHNVEAIYDAIAAAKAQQGKPAAIVLNTKKGHGCILTENVLSNHHINFTAEQMDEALKSARAVLEEVRK